MVVAGRQLGTVTESVPSVRCGLAMKPSAARMSLTSAMEGSMPPRRFTSEIGNSMTLTGSGTSPARKTSLGAAAAEIHDHAGGEIEARHVEGRVDAALVAIAGIGVDAELAAGLGDVERLPQRRLDENVGGRLRASRRARRR